MQSVESETLRASVERLYHVFEKYPLRSMIEGCPHCISAKDGKQIHSRPLRLLSSDDLELYSFKAMTTWGDEQDFRHFLPRIFELIAFDDKFSVDIEIVFDKLPYGKWRKWPVDEQHAIEEYFRALWLRVLSIPQHFLSVDSCICGIAQAVDNIRPYLTDWRRSNKTAVLQLCGFVEENASTLINRGTLSVFWRERQAQVQQIMNWLVEPETTAFLEQTFLDVGSDPAAEEISKAVELVAAMRVARS
jgi:hypothetical protein